jgi:hypothetical protein
VDLKAATQDVVDVLLAAGIRATIDPKSANPPCVLVRPPSITWRFGKGGWDAAWQAWLVVGDSGLPAVLDDQSELINQVQAALNYAAVTARPADTTMSDGATLPTYVLEWTSRIPA